MRNGPHLIVTLVLLLGAAGCVRRAGRNSDCRWPRETVPHIASPRHLSADAEFAEDLAIRYADIHHGLRTPNYVSGEAYAAARAQCMQALFEQVASEHAVPVEQVAGLLGRNRGYIDLAENLPFLLLYWLAAAAVARMVWRQYSPDENGWAAGAIRNLFVSMFVAGGGTMIGETWAWAVEGFRIGNGHMSYRAQRLLWNQHRSMLFVAALIVFWLAAIEAGRRVRSGPVRTDL